MFKTSNIMFSNEKQSFFIIINKREKIADFIKIKLKSIISGSQKNQKKGQHVCFAENSYENIVISTDFNANH